MGKTKRILNGLMAMVVMAGGVIWSGGEARAIEYGSGEGEALATAINAVEDGGSLEVTLTEDVEVVKPMVVQPGAKVTLNLAGHTLYLNNSTSETGHSGWLMEVQSSDTSAAKRGELVIKAGTGGKVTNERAEVGADVKGLIRNFGRLTIEGGEFVDVTSGGVATKATIMNHGINVGSTSTYVSGGLNISGASFLAENGNSCIYTSKISGAKMSRLVGANVISDSSFKTVGNMMAAIRLSGEAGLKMTNVTIESYSNALYVNSAAVEEAEVTLVGGKFISSAGTALTLSKVQVEGVSMSGMNLQGKVGLHVLGSEDLYYNGYVPKISDGVIVGTTRAVRMTNEGGNVEVDEMKVISGGQYGVGEEEDLGRYVVDGKKAYVYAGENGVNRIVEDKVTNVSANLKVGETAVDTLTEGDTAMVVASATPASSSTGFTYESSDESVVKLSDGCNTAKSGSCAVTAVGAGAATITVKSTFEPEVVATVLVTVEEEVIVVPTVLRGTYSTAAGAAVQGSVELMDGAEKVLDRDAGEVGLVIEKTAGSGSTLGTYAVKLVDGEGETIDASLTDGKKWQIKIKLDVVESDDDYYMVDEEKVDFDAASGEISFERAELGSFTVGVVKKKIYIPKTSTTSDGSSVVLPDGEKVLVPSVVTLKVENKASDTEMMTAVEEGLDDLTGATYDARLMGVYDVRFEVVGSGEVKKVSLTGGKRLAVTLKVGTDKFSEKDTGYEVYYVDRSNGYSLTKMDGVEGDATVGTVKFTTSHLSDYAVVALQEANGGGSGGDGGGGSGGDGGGESGGETGGGDGGGESGGGESGGESGGGESGDGGGDSGGESGGETGGGDGGGSENGNESGNESGSGTSGESGGVAGDGGLPAVETDVRKALELGRWSRLGAPDTGVAGAGGGDGGMLGIEVAMWTSGILMSGAYGVRRMYARRGRGS